MRRKAFTLVEIMIVVMIIGILIAIAVPQWFNARENSRQKTCLENLRQIDNAKEIWATENNASDGSSVQQSDLAPAYIKEFPSCPTSGVYTIGVVGVDATCSYQSGNWPHTLGAGPGG